MEMMSNLAMRRVADSRDQPRAGDAGMAFFAQTL